MRRNHPTHFRTAVLPVHLFDKPAHRADERRQFSALRDGVGGIEPVLAGMVIPDRCARRLAPVHSAATVRHRGRPARGPVPCPRSAARAQVHG